MFTGTNFSVICLYFTSQTLITKIQISGIKLNYDNSTNTFETLQHTFIARNAGVKQKESEQNES